MRNSDGGQRSLAAGNQMLVATHNQKINKHKCPSTLSPEIITSIKGLFNKTDPTISFANLSASRSYVAEAANYWTVKLDYWADVNGETTLLHDGEVSVQLICSIN